MSVSGYTQEEKVEISLRHLIPNQMEQHGLSPKQLHIPPDTTKDIINRCTEEHTTCTNDLLLENESVGRQTEPPYCTLICGKL